MKKIVLPIILSVIVLFLSTNIINAYTINNVSERNTAFETENGERVDQKQLSYTLLTEYKTVNLSESVTARANSNTSIDNSKQKNTTSTTKKYNLIIPLLATVALYWGTYILVKKNYLGRISIIKFNGFWNTILFLTLLIPSFGFGIYMLIRIANPAIVKGTFNFLYWHVELSIVMGVLGISHLIQRLGIYLRQLNLKK